jgi:hypothetical protein
VNSLGRAPRQRGSIISQTTRTLAKPRGHPKAGIDDREQERSVVMPKDVAMMLQEVAYTSPIWYTPGT